MGGRRPVLLAAQRAFILERIALKPHMPPDGVPAKGEHVLRVMKSQFGHRKVRYRGIAKNGAQVFALLALANLCLARSRLAPESA
jgi:hypothetical protein